MSKQELDKEAYREIANVLLRSALALKCPQISDLNEIVNAKHNIEWAKNILWDGLPYRPNNWEAVAEAQAIAGEQLLAEIEQLREILKYIHGELLGVLGGNDFTEKDLKTSIVKIEETLFRGWTEYDRMS